MKCPKCHYLGFETGDRCKNCGYDFSLLARGSDDRVTVASEASSAAPSAPLMMPATEPVGSRAGDEVDRLADMPLREMPLPVGAPDAPAAARSRAVAPPPEELPLFTGASLDEEPLVRFPAPPRPPLAVRRRTPDLQRPRPSPVVRRRDDRVAEGSYLDALTDPIPAAPSPRQAAPAASASMAPCPSGARITAALLDFGLLLAIDGLVVYFTLRMAGLTTAEWRLLPPIPLLLFLLLLKVTYYFAFTAIGGQTIGKMATRIRVVAEDGPVVAPALAFRRTLAAAAAIVTLGGTFLPALIGSERRAVHDRMARTRVVSLPVA